MYQQSSPCLSSLHPYVVLGLMNHLRKAINSNFVQHFAISPFSKPNTSSTSLFYLILGLFSSPYALYPCSHCYLMDFSNILWKCSTSFDIVDNILVAKNSFNHSVVTYSDLLLSICHHRFTFSLINFEAISICCCRCLTFYNQNIQLVSLNFYTVTSWCPYSCHKPVRSLNIPVSDTFCARTQH